MFSVKAKSKNGFHRGGRFWPNEETIVDSVPQCVIDEPMLIVNEIEAEVEPVHIKPVARRKTKTK